jgi:hypothetical protein
MGDVNYYGKFGSSGLKLQSGGELVTDRKGLTTGRLVFKVKPEAWSDMPSLLSAHPYASFCVMERRVVRFTPGFWQVYADYAGCEEEETEPVWDFNPGTQSEPIWTHDEFVEKIGGKPSAKLNHSIWVDEVTGDDTDDDSKGVFRKFKIVLPDGTQNPWAGAEEYLTASNTTLTKSWTRQSRPSDSGRPLQVDAPPAGHAPSYPSNYKWLKFPAAYTQRGKVYECRQSWLLSGPKGWNRVIYDGTGTP